MGKPARNADWWGQVSEEDGHVVPYTWGTPQFRSPILSLSNCSVLVPVHPFLIFLQQRDFGERCLTNRCFNLFWKMKGSLLLSCPSKVNYLIFVNVIDYAMEQLSLFLKFFTNKMLVVSRAFDELCWHRDVEMHALYLYSAFVIKGRYMITCTPN